MIFTGHIRKGMIIIAGNYGISEKNKKNHPLSGH